MKYHVYQDTEQWIPLFNWFWLRSGERGEGHGAYPAKWIARLSAWWHTRNDDRTVAEVQAAEDKREQEESERLKHDVEEMKP